MWIVVTALRRPYTFVVLAVLIALFGIRAALTTPTDIFPNINIPVIAVGWTYTGLNAGTAERLGVTPPWATAGLGWRTVGIADRTLNRVFHYRLHSEPGGGDRRLVATIASVAIYSSAD